MKYFMFIAIFAVFVTIVFGAPDHRRYYQANDIVLPTSPPQIFGSENNKISENIAEEMSNYPGSKTFCMNDNDCQPHENCRFNKCIVYVY